MDAAGHVVPSLLLQGGGRRGFLLGGLGLFLGGGWWGWVGWAARVPRVTPGGGSVMGESLWGLAPQGISQSDLCHGN